MGYDLHITLKKQWFDEEGPIIAPKVWRLCVESDPELRFDPENGPLFVRWDGPPEVSEPWLDWHQGDIYTKNPDRALIVKMEAIATFLGAQVQGDEGEIYRGGEPVPPPTPEATDSPAVAAFPSPFTVLADWPTWKLCAVAFLAGCLFLALRLLIFGEA